MYYPRFLTRFLSAKGNRFYAYLKVVRNTLTEIRFYESIRPQNWEHKLAERLNSLDIFKVRGVFSFFRIDEQQYCLFVVSDTTI